MPRKTSHYLSVTSPRTQVLYVFHKPDDVFVVPVSDLKGVALAMGLDPVEKPMADVRDAIREAIALRLDTPSDPVAIDWLVMAETAYKTFFTSAKAMDVPFHTLPPEGKQAWVDVARSLYVRFGIEASA